MDATQTPGAALSADDPRQEALGMCRFVDASPSPFHACEQAAALLRAAGFTALDEREGWGASGRFYVIRGGSLVAWTTEWADGALTPFRIVGAHTDSPNLRVRPQPDVTSAGWQQLAVEVYGGPLLNSWLDRDLGLSGRVAVRGSSTTGGRGTGSGVEMRLLATDEALLRIPQLAPHLDRSVNESLSLNPQRHLTPLWATGASGPTFRAWVAQQVGVDEADVLDHDLMTHVVDPSRLLGRDQDLVSAPRLDNLATSYAGTRALVDAVTGGDVPGAPVVSVLALFDHEEIGSMTDRGGRSTLLGTVLERITRSLGGDRDDHQRALAGSVVASGDMAHAINPNYPEKHEPNHPVRVNAGPVLKVNVNGRYATDATTSGWFRLACEQADVPMQVFSSRGDVPCGTTIGPMTASLLGVPTVDFGAPMLGMHSARELGGALDPAYYVAALRAFLTPA